MTIAAVYRTTDEAIVAAYRQAAEEYRLWVDAIHDFAEAHGGKPVTRRGLGRVWFCGVSRDSLRTNPDGWRDSPGYLVPDKRTRTGKALAAQIKAIERSPDARSSLDGMPDSAIVPSGDSDWTDRMLTPGAELDPDADPPHITVTWSHPLPDDVQVGPQWDRVPLSTYYAEVEAREAS